MGSDSDWTVMSEAAAALAEFGIPHEVEVVSAHRTPKRMIAFGSEAASRGIRVIIAGRAAPPTCRGCSPRSPPCR
jgi:5-(carboxyamino)imidazole ribonucleotide mutase